MGGADADRRAREEDAAWIDLHATFDAIDGERFDAPGVTSDGWSPKDAQNREWFELSRQLDVPTVMAEFHAARTKMRQEWCELGEHGELTSDAVEWFEESGHIHYRDHRRELLAWLDRI